MVFMDKLYFICWTVQSKNQHKYFPFENIYFLHGLTFVKIVPICKIQIIRKGAHLNFAMGAICIDTPLARMHTHVFIQKHIRKLWWDNAFHSSRFSIEIFTDTLVIELTKEQRSCNSSLSRKQFDAGKRARKDLMRDILNSKNRWLNSLWVVSMISK